MLKESLEELVDNENPRNLMKFRMVCDFDDGGDTLITSHLSVMLYVEDVNDHSPEFVAAPYEIEVDELTPVGEFRLNSVHS